MTGHRALAVATKYWRPRQNYLEEIIEAVEGKIRDGDFLAVSEKALSTALGNIVDESTVKPGLNARFVAGFWMRLVWGYFLGFLCHFQPKLTKQLREYPFEMGSRHKQVALQHAGLLGALMFGSEGGIDGSNLPYTYVSLPLKRADKIAEEIRRQALLVLGRRIFVMIVDTDRTYSFRNFHFTPRPRPIRGIRSFGGVVSYVVGRFLGLRRRATPVAVAGCWLSVEKALEIAEVANQTRGFGAGKTVWAMAEKFDVRLDGVSWEMLETVKHKPIVIVRD